MSDDLTPRHVTIRALDEALDKARDTSIYRWPQQQDVPRIADAVLAALDAAGWSITERASTRAYWEAKAVALETELHNLTRNVAAVAAEMNRCADPGVALYYGTKIVAAIEGEVVPDVE